MGRAQGQSHAVAPALRMRGSASPAEQKIYQLTTCPAARMLASRQRRLTGLDVTAVTDPRKRDELQGKRVGVLDPAQQRQLIDFHQQLTAALEDARQQPGAERAVAQLEQLRREAAEMFVLTNSGLLRQWVTKENRNYLAQMSEGEWEHREETAYQEARMAMMTVLRRYQIDSEASPMTYAHVVVSCAMRDMLEKERGGPILFKSDRNDAASRMSTAIHNLQREHGMDAPLSLAQVADQANVELELAARILPHMERPMIRLDAPVTVYDTETGAHRDSVEGRGALFGLPSEPDVADEVLAAEEADMVRAALEDLPPLQQALLGYNHGLDGYHGSDGEDVKLAHTYEGVFIDKTGKPFTSEPTVVNSVEENGPWKTVGRMSQVQLTQAWKNGQMIWEPLTPEASHASQLFGEQRFGPGSPEALAGIPLTSGIVDNELNKAAETLRRSKRLDGIELRYRGDNALENSQGAREMVRRALVLVGDADQREVQKLRAGRARTDGSHKPGPLRAAAEKRGWVEPGTGRLLLTEDRVQELQRTYDEALAAAQQRIHDEAHAAVKQSLIGRR